MPCPVEQDIYVAQNLLKFTWVAIAKICFFLKNFWKTWCMVGGHLTGFVGFSRILSIVLLI